MSGGTFCTGGHPALRHRYFNKHTAATEVWGLVLSPDLIWHMDMYNASMYTILKVIRAGVGYGSRTKTVTKNRTPGMCLATTAYIFVMLHIHVPIFCNSSIIPTGFKFTELHALTLAAHSYALLFRHMEDLGSHMSVSEGRHKGYQISFSHMHVQKQDLT